MAEQGAFFSSDPVDVSFYQTSRLTEPTLPFNGSSEADAWYGSLALPEPFKFPDFSVPPAMTYAAHNEGGGSVDVQDFRAIGFDNLPNTISAADDVGSGPEPGRLGPAAPLPTAGVRRGHTRRQAKRKRVETPEEQADGQVSDG